MSDPIPTPRREPWADSKIASAFLGVSERTLRRYVSEGFVPAYKVAGRRGLRFRLSELEKSMTLVPAKRAYAGTASYGPKARIVTVTEHSSTALGGE